MTKGEEGVWMTKRGRQTNSLFAQLFFNFLEKLYNFWAKKLFVNSPCHPERSEGSEYIKKRFTDPSLRSG